MNIILISWCTIVTIVLLCKLDRVSCTDPIQSLKNTSDPNNSQPVSSQNNEPPPKPPDSANLSQSSNVTLITVNIDLTQSTDHVVYEHDTVNKAQRWTCKEGFLIEKVSKEGKVVWQPKDGRHGDRKMVPRLRFIVQVKRRVPVLQLKINNLDLAHLHLKPLHNQYQLHQLLP
nr:hypothetical protein MACL_00000431 [Theileria orientalis]